MEEELWRRPCVQSRTCEARAGGEEVGSAGATGGFQALEPAHTPGRVPLSSPCGGTTTGHFRRMACGQPHVGAQHWTFKVTGVPCEVEKGTESAPHWGEARDQGLAGAEGWRGDRAPRPDHPGAGRWGRLGHYGTQHARVHSQRDPPLTCPLLTGQPGVLGPQAGEPECLRVGSAREFICCHQKCPRRRRGSGRPSGWAPREHAVPSASSAGTRLNARPVPGPDQRCQAGGGEERDGGGRGAVGPPAATPA